MPQNAAIQTGSNLTTVLQEGGVFHLRGPAYNFTLYASTSSGTGSMQVWQMGSLNNQDFALFSITNMPVVTTTRSGAISALNGPGLYMKPLVAVATGTGISGDTWVTERYGRGRPKNIVTTILDNRTTTGLSEVFPIPKGNRTTYQSVGKVSSGTGTAVVTVAFSADGVTFTDNFTLTMATTTPTGASALGLRLNPYRFVRANVTTLTGADPTVSLYMCSEDKK